MAYSVCVHVCMHAHMDTHVSETSKFMGLSQQPMTNSLSFVYILPQPAGNCRFMVSMCHALYHYYTSAHTTPLITPNYISTVSQMSGSHYITIATYQANFPDLDEEAQLGSTLNSHPEFICTYQQGFLRTGLAICSRESHFISQNTNTLHRLSNVSFLLCSTTYYCN